MTTRNIPKAVEAAMRKGVRYPTSIFPIKRNTKNRTPTRAITP